MEERKRVNTKKEAKKQKERKEGDDEDVEDYDDDDDDVGDDDVKYRLKRRRGGKTEKGQAASKQGGREKGHNQGTKWA